MRTISDLQKAITTVKNTPTSVNAREDPYLMNSIVAKQLQKQVNEENALQKSIIIMQQNSAQFEEGITSSLQSAWSTFDEWQSRMSYEVQESWRGMGSMMSSLEPDAEWLAFADRTDHLLDPETPLRSHDLIDYPGREDPSVLPVHIGWLERKKRLTKSYKEGFYVLTPAGYLHEFSNPDPKQQHVPTLSLFLPNCTLGPPSKSNSASSHKFHLEANKANNGVKVFSRDHSYTFRARSHETMSEWWNDLRMLVSRYLVASETMDRSGPIAAAVRSAGYQSEDESEGGSSVDEAEEEAFDESYEQQPTEEEQYRLQQAKEASDEPERAVANVEGEEEEVEGADEGVIENEDDEQVPAYSSPRESSGIQIGKDGYAVDKKPIIKVNRKSSKRSKQESQKNKDNKDGEPGNIEQYIEKSTDEHPDKDGEGSPGLLGKFREVFSKTVGENGNTHDVDEKVGLEHPPAAINTNQQAQAA